MALNAISAECALPFSASWKFWRSGCVKLAGSGFAGRKAILIYGFEGRRRPLGEIIGAFEELASRRARIRGPVSVPLGSLVHPVFTEARVFGWEIISR